MGVVTEVFGGNENKLGESLLDGMGSKKAFTSVRNALLKDGITVEDRVIDGGSLAIVFDVAGIGQPNGHGGMQEGQDLPSAVLRIENSVKNLPVKHPVVLQPVYRRDIDPVANEGNDYMALLVPKADDISDEPVRQEDQIRTLRVLKAAGLEEHVGDLTRRSQFAFLKGPDGQLLRYPKNASDPDYAGKPIAFIRDANSMPEDLGQASALRRMIDFDGLVEALTKKPVGDLAPAPRDCVAACDQQYAVLKQLEKDMKDEGIEPNVNFMPKKLNWTRQLNVDATGVKSPNYPRGTRKEEWSYKIEADINGIRER